MLYTLYTLYGSTHGEYIPGNLHAAIGCRCGRSLILWVNSSIKMVKYITALIIYYSFGLSINENIAEATTILSVLVSR